MKKLIALALLLVSLPALAQSRVYNASTYAYTTYVTSGNTATGSSSIVAQPTAFAQGMPFLPYNVNASITINRNAANAETITPSTVSNCFSNSLTCTLTGTFTNKHISGESIQSGTFGLQEALNIAVNAGVGTVLIDASWGGPSGSSLIASAKGSSNVMIQDNRNPSGATFYQWNGTNYIETGGGTSSGIQSINGDTTQAQLINCSGTGISCGTSGGTTIISLSGGGITGTVNSGTLGQVGGYSATGTAIGPATGLWSVQTGYSTSQINTVFANAHSAGGTVIIPDGTPQTALWTTNNTSAKDYRKFADYLQAARYGLACNYSQLTVTLTSGSNLVNVGSSLSASDVGKTMSFGYQTGYGYQAAQYSWQPTITAYTFPNATLSGNAPFGATLVASIGTLNTTALQAFFTDASYIFPLRIPTGCKMLTGTVNMTAAASIKGQQMIAGGFVGLPGQDVFAQPQAGGATTSGMVWDNFDIVVDDSIDPARGSYTQYTTDGTGSSTVAAMYRPGATNSQLANRTTADQWVTNGHNGVASVTAGSAVICVPNALGYLPPNGYTIVFPYMTTVFNTTVQNQTGAGCSAGFTGVTLNANVPSGQTLAQAYFIAGSAFNMVVTPISTTVTYPTTITVTLPNAPDPAGESGAAPWGHVIIGNNSGRFEADYLGNNYSTTAGSGTFVLRRGPGTSPGFSGNAAFIIPANPCPAQFETPEPVYPNINTADTTPSGAVPFPGVCYGNAAIAFPQADGHASAATGLAEAVLENIEFDISQQRSGNGDFNSSTALYEAGNSASYSSNFQSLKIIGTEYGFVQGPASKNQWGVAAVGPTGAGNKIENCQIRAAFPIILTDFQQSSIDRCDTYTTMISPYDGSQIGAATAFLAAQSINDQTGGAATFVSNFSMRDWNGEPEGGNNQAVPVYFQSDALGAVFQTTQVEGAFVIFGGQGQIFQGTQIALPFINYGSNNIFTITTGAQASYATNKWGDGKQYLNWGTASACMTTAGGQGPYVACGVGYTQPYQGHDITSTLLGLGLNNVENPLGGMIVPGEWSSNLDAHNMSVGFAIDPTEPFWGSYTACNLGSGAQCEPGHFDGFSGAIYIGAHNRIAPAQYTLEMNAKSAAASGSMMLAIDTFDSGTGQCASSGTIANVSIATTTAWQHYSIPIDFTGHQGCALTVQFYNGTTTDQYRIGEFNFIPVGLRVGVQVQTPTEGASCPVSGTIVGMDASYLYVCSAGSFGTGTIKRVAIS